MVCAAAAAWSSAAAAPALTPRNSVLAPLVLTQTVRFDGVGCGVPASASVTLPAGASQVRVRSPLVGALEEDAQVTGAVVQGDTVTVTAVAVVPEICDPAESSVPPPERPWLADAEVQVRYTVRVGVVHANRDGPFGKPYRVRPPEVRIRFAVAARGVRWARFGGRTAVGFGTLKSLVPCAGGCRDDGTRLRVELTRPSRCAGQTLPGSRRDAVFYAKVAFVLRERLGVLRPGTEWISTRITCPPAGAPPIPVR